MSQQPHDLHRALLRPAIIHTLRAAGFHSTKPSVLDTLVSLAEQHLLLLAQSTALHAVTTHNDIVPTLTDVRMALTDVGVLTPFVGAAEEEWRERMRRPLREMRDNPGGRARVLAERRRRDELDERDVRDFVRWFEGPAHAEIRRVAGLVMDKAVLGGVAGGAGGATTAETIAAAPASVTPAATATVPAAAAIGVGGRVVQAEDFLTVLKKKHGKAAEEGRFAGTALGQLGGGEERTMVIEGGPVQNLREWRPSLQERSANIVAVNGR